MYFLWQVALGIISYLSFVAADCELIGQGETIHQFPIFDLDCADIIICNVKIEIQDKQVKINLYANSFNFTQLELSYKPSIAPTNKKNLMDPNDSDANDSIDLVMSFVSLVVIENCKMQGLFKLEISTPQDTQTSIVQLVSTQISSNKILIYSGYVSIDSSSIISLFKNCKTFLCSCTASSDCDTKIFQNLKYLSILQDSTSSEFDIQATCKRYEAISFLELLQSNVFSDKIMKFQILIFAFQNISMDKSSLIQASNIAAYATQLTIEGLSSINTVGYGCESRQGNGCGIYDSSLGLYQCGGSGGSYAGQGGNPMSLNYIDDISCNEIQSRYLYGDFLNPIFEGSGGGSQGILDPHVSAGGGVIYIETVLLTSLTNSTIDASGTGNSDFESNSGGGSGGSIQIHTSQLSGNYSEIKSNGGDSFGSGGSGAGGRIKLNLTQWYNLSLWMNLRFDTLNVTVDPGLATNSFIQNIESNKIKQYLNSTIGQSGSVSTTPCPAQFEIKNGYRCTSCPQWTFKTFIGWSDCVPCQNIPSNSEPTIGPNQCSFKCSSSYHEQSQQCVTSTENLLANVGGWEVIIPSFTFLICTASLILICAFKGKRRRGSITEMKFQQALINNNNNMNNGSSIINREEMEEFSKESQKRPDFHVEDLPYHMKRIYLHGENTNKKPWKINILDSDFEIESLAIEFNEMSKYTNLQTRVLLVFKLVYIVSYFWASRYMKTIKLKELKSLIRNHQVIKLFYDTLEDSNLFRYKLSASSDLSLAFIDVFDYNKTVFDYQYKTNFPVCLVIAGKGSFISPFNVQVEDPLCKSLYFTFQQRESLEENIESNPSVLKFEKFLKKFNMLAKLIDYSTREKTFLKNFSELVKYVDSQNKKFFSSYGIEADICIHKLVREKYVSQQEGNIGVFGETNVLNHLQSRIIMLSFKDQGDLINCLKDTHYLKNYSKYYEIKISLNFYQISKVIHNDQVEIKTENNINKQIETYINYEQEAEEFTHLMDKMKKKNYSSAERRNDDFIPKVQRIQDVYDHHYTDSTLDENKCLWLSLIVFYVRRAFGAFKSSFLTYRKTHISNNLLGFLMLFTIILNFISVIATFVSLNKAQYLVPEIIIILIIYPLCFAISPLIMIVWLVKHTERIGKIFMLFNYNAFYTQIAIFIFGLIDLVQSENSHTIDVLISIAQMSGIVTTWLMSYFGSGYILLQEMI